MTKIDRITSPALDAILGVEHKVLDHGFIRVVDYMGDDTAIVQAARVSYGAGTKAINEDRGLLRYLMRHKHSTPFEMCEIKLHVKLPIFVARQWIRHRTANVNEYSARYSILAREFYVPAPGDIEPQSKTNKQGRDGSLPEHVQLSMANVIRDHSERAFDIYEELGTGYPWFHADGSEVTLDDDFEQHDKEHGMARELARTVLPLNAYTEWYWKVDLHNLLHFLKLRADPHAQWEIRAYAEVLLGLIRPWVPHTVEAFEDYVMHSVMLSRQEIEALRAFFRDAQLDRENDGWPEPVGLSARELTAFQQTLGLLPVEVRS